MANIKSAAKRAKQNLVRRDHNASVLSAIKTSQKKVRDALVTGTPDTAKAEVQRLSSALDKAAKRGIIHKNMAARKKSRLAKALVKSAPAVS